MNVRGELMYNLCKILKTIIHFEPVSLVTDELSKYVRYLNITVVCNLVSVTKETLSSVKISDGLQTTSSSVIANH